MDIRDFYEDNIQDYLEWVGMDMAENMSRMYFRGIAVCDDIDDSLKAGLIWELKSVEKQMETASEIVWIHNADREGMEYALDEYGKRVSAENVGRSFFETGGLDSETGEILESRGFELKTVESRDLSIPLKDFRPLFFLKKKQVDYILNLDSISTTEFNQGMARIMFNRDVGALEDICYLPKDWYDQKISCCVKTDSRINGFLLVHRFPSGILTPVLLYAAGPYSQYDLLYMLRYSIVAALKTYPEDTVVKIRRRNEAVRALIAKIFPLKKGEEATAGERMEKNRDW